jgi:Fur family peroxide stress response transcriptional regulator
MKANDYLTTLRQHGLRITEQRRVICEYLAQTDSHPTPAQVHAGVAAHHPEISRATVYNTLNALRDLGLIVEISIGSDHSHFDTDPTPHTNLICLRCHQITDYPAQNGQGSFYKEIFDQIGFRAVASQQQIVGFCQSCREQRRAEIVQQGTTTERPQP